MKRLSSLRLRAFALVPALSLGPVPVQPTLASLRHDYRPLLIFAASYDRNVQKQLQLLAKRREDLQTRQILDELPALSDKISIEEVNFVLEAEKAALYGIDRVPAIAIVGQDAGGADRDSHIRFLGTPAGYEFISLIHAVRLAGGGASHLSAEGRARVASVDRPMTMHVFTTPTCPHCPRSRLTRFPSRKIGSSPIRSRNANSACPCALAFRSTPPRRRSTRRPPAWA